MKKRLCLFIFLSIFLLTIAPKKNVNAVLYEGGGYNGLTAPLITEQSAQINARNLVTYFEFIPAQGGDYTITVSSLPNDTWLVITDMDGGMLAEEYSSSIHYNFTAGQRYVLNYNDSSISGIGTVGVRDIDFGMALSTVEFSNTTPTVSDVSPANSATNIPIAGNIVITFSEEMNINTGTRWVQLNSLAALASGIWSNGNKTYTIPYSGLDYNTSYTVYINGFVNIAGNAIANNSSNSFTTMAETTPPTVASISPANSAIDLPIDGSIQITFDEAMKTTVGTVQLNTTTLSAGSWSNGDKTYTVAYSGLTNSTSHTVTIKDFQDTAGNTMTTDANNRFTTVADTIPPTVASVTPVNGAIDLPISGNIIINFNEEMTTTAGVGTVQLNTTTLSAGSWSNGNKTYTVAYTGLDNSTSHTVTIKDFKDAVSNTMVDNASNSFTTVKETTPPTVASVTPANGTIDLPIDGNIIITFNEEMTTTAGVGTVQLNTTTLSAGSWSDGNKTYTVAYTGLDNSTNHTVTIKDFQDAANNTMIANAGNSFTTVKETTLPTVASVTPANGAIDLPISGNIIITFNEEMTTTAGVGTVQLNTTTLSAGSWSNGNKTYTVAYTGLDNSTSYTVTIKDFKDAADNTMTANTSNRFTTVADTIPPTVASVTPVNGAIDLPISGNIVITFNEEMTTTAGVGTVQLNTTTLSAGSWSNGNKTYTVAYTGLDNSTSYTVTIKDFKDAAVNTMVTNANNSFTTVKETTPPTVSSISPTNSAIDLPISGNIIITFNEEMTTTAGVGTVQLDTSTLSAGSWSNGNKTYTVAYTSLDNSTSYTVTIKDFKDAADNTMATNASNSFTTIKETTPPTVASVTPANGAIDLSISGNIIITFNEEMTTTAGVGTVQLNTTTLSAGSWSNSNKTYTVAYTGLDNSASHTVTIKDFKDAADNTMATNASNSFTTIKETTPPTVASVTPANGTIDLPISGNIIITFNEEMTTTAGVGTVQLNTATLSAGSWSNSNKTYTVAYTGLDNSASHTVTIKDFKDAADNTMVANANNSFTTVKETTPPTVSNVTPANGAIDLPISGSIVITFNEEMTITAGVGTVQLNSLTAITGGSWSSNHKTYTVTYSDLDYNTNYNIKMTGFKDAVGNTMADNTVNSFLTIADTFAPTVSIVSPANKTASAFITGNIVITFDEPMNTTAGVGTVQLNALAAITGGSWSNANKTYTVAYTGLEYSTNYTIKITGFKDAVGNTMSDNTSNSFTTVAKPVDNNPAPPSEGAIPPVVPANVEQITVDVKQGDTDNTVSQITIERATDTEGNTSDTVTYEEKKATETIEKLKEEKKDVARIVIPDAEDKVSETTVNIPSKSLEVIAEGDINLQIDTEEAKIDIPKESLQNVSGSMEEDLYFNLVPIEEKEQKEAVTERALFEVTVLNGDTQSSISVIGTPVTIETNMPSTAVDITLPLTGITIPTDPTEREALLKQLAVYIEHSDGDKELDQGEIVEYKDGVLGIKFHITKFSIFTVVQTDAFTKPTVSDVTKSTTCDVTKVTTPKQSTINGKKITATVAYKVSTITIKVNISDKATWELYSDKACTKKIMNHKMKLSTGTNKVYIKVTAEDGKTSKVYTLNITRKAAPEVQYETHVKFGLIGSNTYAEKVAKILKQDYDSANVVVVKEGKYYRIYADFTNKTAAEETCKELIKKEYIVNYYFYK